MPPIKTLVAASLLIAPAIAQSNVVGFAYKVSDGTRCSFNSTTDDFVADFTPSAPSFLNFREFDLDATATTAWSFNRTTSQIGTANLVTSVLSPIGNSGVPPNTIIGFTAHPDGTKWYALSRDGLDSQLYQGEMVADSFVPVGPVHSGYAFMNLACDGQGNLFSVDVVTDALYKIDPVTGALSLMGPIGLELNYANGLDFDWSTGWLYAYLLTTGVTESYFARLDPATGAILDSEDTLAFNSQVRFAIAQPAPIEPVTISTFCDPANNNSTGLPTVLSGSALGAGGTSLHLDANQGPPFAFGYFMIGNAASDPGLAISLGRMCLGVGPGESIGRYYLAGTAMNSLGAFNSLGVFENLSTTSTTGFGFDVPCLIPVIGSPVILAGETWNFQLWHRDEAAGPGASNFSNGVQVVF